MCTNCNLITPRGAHDICHACAVSLRAEARRGLEAIEEYLDGWSLLQRWGADEE